MIERLAAGGKIVELACGDGSLAAEIDKAACCQYIGYDISRHAIEKAIGRQLPGCQFHVGTMEEWPGCCECQLVVMEECIYYLSADDRRVLPNRIAGSIGKEGYLIITVHDHKKYAAVLDDVLSAFRVVESHCAGLRSMLALAVK
jgi:trans-aconitate methyltransferase